MDSRKTSRDALSSKDAAPAPQSQTPFERAVAVLITGLPELNRKDFDEALAAFKERPRASMRHLLDLFAKDDPAAGGIAAKLMREIGGADIVDNLNALIFDTAQNAVAKVRANDLLDELGAAIDPDVLAMSVPDAEELRKKLPSQTLKLLHAGDTAAALSEARALTPPERWLVIYAAAEREKAQALPFLTALANDNAENAMAAIVAVANEKMAEGVPMLMDIQRTQDRDVQKLIKRVLFDLRTAGVEVPTEEKPAAQPVTAPATEGAEDAMPLYRAVMSAPSPQGLVLVTVARLRSNGRLKVFSVLVDLWKRGIQQAALRMDMSKSSFDRFLQGQGGPRMKLADASLEDCRRMVARGVRVAREFGFPMPYDFGMGRALLGDLDRDIAALENPFLCSACGQPLDAPTIEKIRALAPYENMPAETRCAACREKKA